MAAAIDRWTTTGLTRNQLATLRRINFEVADLGDTYLGEAADGVRIDRNAGGKGWYTGSDLSSDSLFSHVAGATRRYTDSTSAPAGHIDLLTAIEHEMGHKLGFDDTYSASDRDSLMYGFLTVGERRLPAQPQAHRANTSVVIISPRPGLKAPESATAAKQASLSVRNSSVFGKAIPKASAAEVARIYHSEVPLSHHAVRSNFKAASQDPNAPTSGETVTLNTIATFPAGGKSITIKYSATVNTPPPWRDKSRRRAR